MPLLSRTSPVKTAAGTLKISPSRKCPLMIPKSRSMPDADEAAWGRRRPGCGRELLRAAIAEGAVETPQRRIRPFAVLIPQLVM